MVTHGNVFICKLCYNQTMKLLEIYSKYKTLPNLQLHMLRVSAVAQILLDHWIGQDIDKKSILETCLLHDIAKPVTFDLSKQKLYVKNEQELKEVVDCTTFLVNTYGTEEHPALLKIGKEIGVSKKTLKLLNDLEWHYTQKLMAKHEIESLIPIYCDMRVSPLGVQSLKERLKDLKIRTNKGDEELQSDSENLEKLIQRNTNIDLNCITDTEIEPIIDVLKTYEFK